MPGDPRQPCRIQPISQVSTGQAGAQIETDLNTLFATINTLARCVGKIADFLDAQGGGTFAGGSGGGSSGSGSGSTGTGTGAGQSHAMFVQRVSTGSNYSVPYGFTGLLLIDATADINVTMPPPEAGFPVVVMNVGAAHTITLKDDLGSTINPPIIHGGWTTLMPIEDSANAPTWPAATVVFYPNGTIHTAGNVVITNNAMGLVLKSANGHYWLEAVDNAGSPSTGDQGTPTPV